MSDKLILLVEDNKKVQNYNRRMLEDEHFAVEVAMTLAAAWEILSDVTPDAIVLDIGMPDGSGLDFLRELRERDVRTPVLLLTGYGETRDIVAGFEAGCDDYLPKPYTFAVLLVRLRHLLRKVEQVPEAVSKGSLTLRIISREAYVGERNLRLTPKDFALLQFFVQSEDRLMDAATIYEKVWGQPMASDSQALSIAVSRLRKKLAGCGYTISAEYGEGYRFERGDPL
jgi:DNA-binding response OmpR family regulator